MREECPDRADRLPCMAARRTYGDRCGIARALDVAGERWALLVVRELLLGPKRFTDLRGGLPHLGPDVLSQRLRDLEGAGVVRRAVLPPPAGSRVYELTEWGREIEPALLELGRWGSRAPFPATADAGLGVDAVVLALKTTFDPAASDGLTATYALRLGDQRFALAVAPGRLEVGRGDGGAADATIATDPGTLAELLWHGGAVAEAQRAGRLRIEGDAALAERFLRLFPPGR
jgi:DNA-binding HxlR family transcriptional regulator